RGYSLAYENERIEQSFVAKTHTLTRSAGCPAPGPSRNSAKYAGVPSNRARMRRMSVPVASGTEVCTHARASAVCFCASWALANSVLGVLGAAAAPAAAVSRAYDPLRA